MKQRIKPVIVVFVLMLAMLTVAACGRKTEEVKVEQTVETFMTGYANNNSAQMLSAVAIDETKKADFEELLDQVLQALHNEEYSVKLDYTLDQIQVIEDQAQLNLSAVVRIYENGVELFSFRLFNNQPLYLLKDTNGEWKIDFKQYLPEDFFSINLF